jgi:hypothetical protein
MILYSGIVAHLIPGHLLWPYMVDLPRGVVPLCDRTFHVTILPGRFLEERRKELKTYPFPDLPLSPLIPRIWEIRKENRISWFTIPFGQDLYNEYARYILMDLGLKPPVELQRRVFHVTLATPDGCPYRAVSDIYLEDLGRCRNWEISPVGGI